MSTVTPYPNGQSLISDALTLPEINTLIQALTYGMLGLPANNPQNAQLVRIDWPIEGQPFGNNNQDICYIRCLLVPENPYSRIRDMAIYQENPEATLYETWNYTRVWRIGWTFYGPNSTDRARMVWSAMFMDYFNWQLANSNLYPVSEIAEPRRAPENFNAQWWERTDLEVEMYEAVSEAINQTTVTSVELIVESNQGQLADITISKE